MEHESLPQYMRIATNLAFRIASGEILEGEKLSGRSTLSSEFSVSPETVRKSLRLLADIGIVEVREGRSTRVLSAEKAREYLEAMDVRQEQIDLRNKLRELFNQYRDVGRQMVEISSSLIAASSAPLPSEQRLPNYEVEVPLNTDKAGMTLGDLRFWQCTGATVVAIRRGQRVTVSPGPYVELRPGDVLVYVGQPGCKQAVEQLLSGKGADRSLYSIQGQILSAIHAGELSVIARALGASLGDITEITTLSKGMTNRSYRFTCKGEKYILRIPGEGTNLLIDRKQEAAVYDAIRGRGLCDDPAYLNPDNGLKVTRFLEGVRTCDPYREEDLVRAMETLRRFHGMDLRVDHSFPILEKIQFYEDLWEGAPSVYPDYMETKARVLSLRDYVLSHRGALCLAHIDAVPDNILFYPREGREEIQLTDWEYAAMQDPLVDVAMFCIYAGYDRARIDHLIDLYFEGPCPREKRILIYCYISACGLLWSNWCEYKRHLGVEFGEYAHSQYAYARDFYSIVRKELEKL